MSKTIKLAKAMFRAPKKVSKQVKNYVKRAIDRKIQDKVVTYDFSTNVGTAGIILPIGLLTKGEEQWTREGTQIQPKHMHIRGTFIGQETRAVMRIIAGYFKTVNGVLPSVNEVIRNLDNTGATGYDVFSPYSQFTRDNVVIKMDKMYKLSGFAATENVSTQSFYNDGTAVVNRKIKLKKRILYNAAGNVGDITDINTGLPFVLLITDNNVNLANYDLKVTLTFEDA